MWQTDESSVSPSNATPFASSSRRASSTSGTRNAIDAVCGAVNSEPMFFMSSR